jgi:hypothetical protein
VDIHKSGPLRVSARVGRLGIGNTPRKMERRTVAYFTTYPWS